MGLLAQALRHSGAWDEALSKAEEALALAVEIGAPYCPDPYQLKGEVMKEGPTAAHVGEPPAADQAEARF
jgi:hypothetical protein